MGLSPTLQDKTTGAYRKIKGLPPLEEEMESYQTSETTIDENTPTITVTLED